MRAPSAAAAGGRGAAPSTNGVGGGEGGEVDGEGWIAYIPSLLQT